MPYRVLIVEDNSQFSENIASIFEEDLDYLVTAVDTAEAGQRLLHHSQREDDRFDLVITDMNLRGDDAVTHGERLFGGLQVLEMLRRIHKHEIGVILSGESLPTRDVAKIFDEYRDIVPFIIDKRDDVYARIMGEIHPRVVRNSQQLFLSYRRQDSGDITGRIYDNLLKYFHASRVFRDVNSIGGGEDFRVAIREALGQCNIMLAVIGPDWLTITDANGKPRLQNEDDMVRFEIEEALRQEKIVIPLLVRGASIPTAAQLPPEIERVSYFNAIRVRTEPDFYRDIEHLIEKIDGHFGTV